MDTRRCAETCATSAYFALQDGKCQCAAKFGLSPKVSKTEPEACGPVCPGEEGLSPLRRCGLAGRNAVWAHSTCLLGAAFELASTLSPAEGMVQFKAGILISSAIAAITAAQLTTLSTWSPSPPPMPPLPPPPPGVVNLQTATGHSLLSSCAAGCRERCDIEETTSFLIGRTTTRERSSPSPPSPPSPPPPPLAPPVPFYITRHRQSCLHRLCPFSPPLTALPVFASCRGWRCRFAGAEHRLPPCCHLAAVLVMYNDDLRA